MKRGSSKPRLFFTGPVEQTLLNLPVSRPKFQATPLHVALLSFFFSQDRTAIEAKFSKVLPFFFVQSSVVGTSKACGVCPDDVAVPGVHDPVPGIDEDDSVVVPAAVAVASAPERGAPARPGGVRFRRKGDSFSCLGAVVFILALLLRGSAREFLKTLLVRW